MRRIYILIFLSLILASCTTTRWVVTDQNAVDTSATPQTITEETVFVLEEEPTVEAPVAGFTLYRIKDLEYPERVQVERSVQKYKPKWGFMILGLAGAGIAATAANTDLVFNSASTAQKLGLNLAAGLISILSVANMEASGPPIFTGETKLMRRSGSEVTRDSLRVQLEGDSHIADVSVAYEGEPLFSQTDVVLERGGLDLNLASFADTLSGIVQQQSELTVELMYDGAVSRFDFPISQFLTPHLNVTSIVANLKTTPERSEFNTLSEVGRGSFLEILDEEDENWYRVLFEGDEVFIEKEAGIVEWISTVESGPALVFEFADLPFGEIDVEHSLPILRQNKEEDRSLIISNGLNNEIGQRQYLGRDHQLFEAYMSTSLQLDDNQMQNITEPDLLRRLQNTQVMDQNGSLYVYLSGFADITESDGNPSVALVTERDGETSSILLNEIFSELIRINPERLYLFADLEYIRQTDRLTNGFNRNGTAPLLQQSANMLLRELPNSAIVFSNKPGQHSAIYSGLMEGNKRHSVFNYYWAEAIQQRKTRISTLVNHLERNIDYTSRKLHDQPQEIQAFGNLTLNLTR